MADLNQGVRQTGPRYQDGVTNVNAAVVGQTGIYSPILPNQRGADAGEHQNGSGQQDANQLASSIKSLTDTGIVRVVNRLTGRPVRPPVVAGQDNVLHNVGINGANTFAMGSLRPTQYQRQFDKSQMGKQIRVTGGEPGDWRAQIASEMTLARVNRPLNRDLIANGHYDQA